MKRLDAFCNRLDRILFGFWRAGAVVLFGGWMLGWLPSLNPSSWDLMLAGGIWLVGNLVQQIHDR